MVQGVLLNGVINGHKHHSWEPAPAPLQSAWCLILPSFGILRVKGFLWGGLIDLDDLLGGFSPTPLKNLHQIGFIFPKVSGWTSQENMKKLPKTQSWFIDSLEAGLWGKHTFWSSDSGRTISLGLQNPATSKTSHILLMVQKSAEKPVDMVNISSFTGFYTSQVVQDFLHQQCHHNVSCSFAYYTWHAVRC